MANPVSETQSINPGSVIELFELTTDAALHGSATTYRFHSGTNEINNGNLERVRSIHRNSRSMEISNGNGCR